LKQETDLRPQEIDKVRCGVIYRVPEILLYSDPTTGLEAKFSLEYCVARALREGAIRLEHFSEKSVTDPEIRRLMGRISKYIHPEGKDRSALEREFAEVQVVFKDGRCLTRRIYEQRGHPKNPLSDEELIAKYRDCAGRILKESNVERSLEQVLNIESISKISELFAVVTNS
jgi:2-methylcitrate dehydratase PrpD